MRGSRKLIVVFFVLCFAVLGCEKEPASTGGGAEAETSANLPETGKETAMSINVQWLNHASFRITHRETVIYIDPWKLKSSAHDATAILTVNGGANNVGIGTSSPNNTLDVESDINNYVAHIHNTRTGQSPS